MARTAILEPENEVTMRHPKTDYGFDNKDIAKTVIIQKDGHGFVKKSTNDSLYCRVIESRLDLFNGDIGMTILSDVSDDDIDNWDNVCFFARYEESNTSFSEFHGCMYVDFRDSIEEMECVDVNTDPNNYCVMYSIRFPLDALLSLCSDLYDENKDYDAIAFYMRRSIVDPETSATTFRYYVFRLDYKFIDRYLQQAEPDNKNYYFPVEVIGSITLSEPGYELG